MSASHQSSHPSFQIRHDEVIAADKSEQPHSAARNQNDDIAVLGFDLRFPQHGSSPAGFWQMLEERQSAMTDFPNDRLNIESFYDSQRRPATLPFRGAHFVDGDIAAFDADFFSISPAEATAIDPQQRILLEVAYRAFENAGIRIEDVKGSNTAVITGTFTNDYFTQALKDPEDLPPSMAIGATLSMVANRLSWFFDFKGPSMNVDSACASSAMALQQACDLLQRGDCDMAVVAASNLILDPDFSIALGNMQFTSPDSRSYAFDERANGYARGEGFGVLILKRVQDAYIAGNVFRSVIRAVRSNQDGRTPGITQPCGRAQRDLVEQTYRSANLSLEHTRFFEAHGTGTAIGDPAEANAIIESFRPHRSAGDPLHIGAVKSNIGHLEGASGIAALLKTIMILESGIIPPNANFETQNPQIYNTGSCVSFPTKTVAWPECSIRRASVSSFGYGGSNCHIVLDDACSYLRNKGLPGRHRTSWSRQLCQTESVDSIVSPKDATCDGHRGDTPVLLTWSAHSAEALRASIKSWRQYSQEKLKDGELSISLLGDIAYTLGSHRSRLPHRSYSVVNSITDLSQIDPESLASTEIKSKPRICFVFTGQGAQWYAMGRELLHYDAFARHIECSTRVLNGLGCTWSIREELCRTKETSRIDDPELAQPLTAIIQIGLVKLLRLAGVRPTAVIGHSMGEIAAAYSIGAFDSASAVTLAFYRGQLVASIPQRDSIAGGMLAVGLGATEVQAYFHKVQTPFTKYPLLSSCHNSPSNTTVSGEVHQLEELRCLLESDGIFARVLRVSAAYHSTQLKQISADCLEKFKNINHRNGQLTGVMISTVTGRPITKERLSTDAYWVENMISPVLFTQAISYLCAKSSEATNRKLDRSHHENVFVDTLLEVGPHSALALPIRETITSLLPQRKISYLSCLSRNKPADCTLQGVLGELWSLGAPIDILFCDTTYSDRASPPIIDERRLITDGPRYPFVHNQRFWHEGPISHLYRLKDRGPLALLGQRMREWRSFAPEWRHRIDSNYLSWLPDHRIGGSVLYTAAAMILTAIKAAKEIGKESHRVTGYVLHRLRFLRSIVLPTSDSTVDTRCTLSPQTERETSYTFSLYFMLNGQWHLAFSCEIQTEQLRDESVGFRSRSYFSRIEQDRALCDTHVERDELYKILRGRGFGYGPSFQAITQASYDSKSRACGTVHLASSEDQKKTDGLALPLDNIHPGSLDAILQVLLVALSKGGTAQVSSYIIDSIDRLWISSVLPEGFGQSAQVSASLVSTTDRECIGDIFALNSSGEHLLFGALGFQTTAITSPTPSRKQTVGIGNCFSIVKGAELTLSEPRDVLSFLDKEVGRDATGPIEFHRRVHNFVQESMAYIVSQNQDLDAISRKPHLQRYVSWLKAQPRLSSPTWTECNRPVLQLQSIDEVPTVDMFKRVAENCVDILHKDNAVEILFHDNLASRFYESQSAGSLYYDKLTKYLQAAAFVDPNMNLLEIGAGTGSFTQHVLAALSSTTEEQRLRLGTYTFSDISPAFFGEARDKFREYEPQVEYKTLNVQRSPLEQSFQAGSYDMIVASNVLHLCQDLQTSLKNLRRLLKPDGRLILHENTCPEKIESGFVFGLTPAWWIHGDEHRLSSPLLTMSDWDKALKSAGFMGSQLAIPDFASTSCHTMDIIISIVANSVTLDEADSVSILSDQESVQSSDLSERSQAISNTCMDSEPFQFHEMAFVDDSGQSRAVTVVFSDDRDPILSNMTSAQFTQLQSAFSSIDFILWIACGQTDPFNPHHGAVKGFLKVLGIENPGLRSTLLEIWSPNDLPATVILSVLARLVTVDCHLEETYTFDHGIIQVERAIEATEAVTGINSALNGTKTVTKALSLCRPFLMSVQEQDPTSSPTLSRDHFASSVCSTQDTKVEVTCINAPLSNTIYSESLVYTGVSQGRKLGFVAKQGVRSSVWIPPAKLFEIPSTISLQDGATILEDLHLAVLFAVRSAGLTSSDTALICATGSLIKFGIVTLSLALCRKVYVTVDSQDEAAYIEATWGLSRIHVVAQHDVTGSLPRDVTGRPTCIISLDNSLPAADIPLCLRPFGRFLCCQTQTGSQVTLPSVRSKNVSVQSLDRDILGEDLEVQEHRHVQELLDQTWVSQVAVKGYRKMDMGEIMASLTGQYNFRTAERVIIDLESDPTILYTSPSEDNWQLDSNAGYVVAGGFGDLGRCVVKWLASRGARCIAILSRSGPRSEEARTLIETLTARGVLVVSPTCDISDRMSVAQALGNLPAQFSRVRGCIQVSGAIKDTTYEKMTFEDWQIATKPKIQGSWNLHELLPQDMDFFVLSSSISGIIGQATQINYSSGNTFQDALARYRTSLGMRTVSLDLGLLSMGGLLSQRHDLFDRFMSTGHYNPITETHIGGILQYYCNSDTPLTLASEAQLVIGVRTPRDIVVEGYELLAALETPLWSLLRPHSILAAEGRVHVDEVDLMTLLSDTESTNAAETIVLDRIVQRLSHTLSIPESSFNIEQAVHEYGADSLTAIDLKNWVFKNLRVDLPVFDVLGDTPIKDIARLVTHLWRESCASGA